MQPPRVIVLSKETRLLTNRSEYSCLKQYINYIVVVNTFIDQVNKFIVSVPKTIRLQIVAENNKVY